MAGGVEREVQVREEFALLFIAGLALLFIILIFAIAVWLAFPLLFATT